MDQKLKNYSSGMQVRLAFSVATRAEADIMLVDEVLAVGDADFQRKCFDYFKSLKKSGKTIIFVTHDMGAVSEYCDRAILIKDGVIAHEGPADEIADQYLKLFNENTEASNDLADEEDRYTKNSRWGDGKVSVDKFTVDITDKIIEITVNLKAADKEVEGVVFGYNFTNSEGKLIMGGNTLNSHGGKRLSFYPGEAKKLRFKMDNILGSGSYSVNVVARLSDGVTICDNLTNAAQVKIAKKESYYPIIAPAVMTEEQ
jgi:ABC-2 type transport system ATP-binding protein